MIYLKSPEEIAIMREGGAILGGLLDNVILCKILVVEYFPTKGKIITFANLLPITFVFE